MSKGRPKTAVAIGALRERVSVAVTFWAKWTGVRMLFTLRRRNARAHAALKTADPERRAVYAAAKAIRAVRYEIRTRNQAKHRSKPEIRARIAKYQRDRYRDDPVFREKKRAWGRGSYQRNKKRKEALKALADLNALLGVTAETPVHPSIARALRAKSTK